PVSFVWRHLADDPAPDICLEKKNSKAFNRLCFVSAYRHSFFLHPALTPEPVCKRVEIACRGRTSDGLGHKGATWRDPLQGHDCHPWATCDLQHSRSHQTLGSQFDDRQGMATDSLADCRVCGVLFLRVFYSHFPTPLGSVPDIVPHPGLQSADRVQFIGSWALPFVHREE